MIPTKDYYSYKMIHTHNLFYNTRKEEVVDVKERRSDR